MSTNPVVWFEIYVQDMARARRFYETVFQLTLAPLPTPVPGMEMLAFAGNQERYGICGALVKMAGGPSGGNTTIVYFHCEDCTVEEARIAPAGGQLIRPTFSIGEYGRIALAQDTEGNMIGLHSM